MDVTISMYDIVWIVHTATICVVCNNNNNNDLLEKDGGTKNYIYNY